MTNNYSSNSERRRRDADSDGSSDEDTPSPESSSMPAVAGSNAVKGSNTSYFNPDRTQNATAYNVRSNDEYNASHAKTQKVWVEDFHLFYSLAAVPQVSPDTSRSTIAEENGNPRKKSIPITIDRQQLDDKMSQMQRYITQDYRVGRRAYAQCPREGVDRVEARKSEIDRLTKGIGDRDNIDERLREEARLPEIRNLSRRRGRWRSSSGRSRSRSSHASTSPNNRTGFLHPEASRSIVRLAKQTFTFFLPLDASSQMIEKYWGAVYWLLDVGISPARLQTPADQDIEPSDLGRFQVQLFPQAPQATIHHAILGPTSSTRTASRND